MKSKGGTTMASKYDNMSREELLAAMKEKKQIILLAQNLYSYR